VLVIPIHAEAGRLYKAFLCCYVVNAFYRDNRIIPIFDTLFINNLCMKKFALLLSLLFLFFAFCNTQKPEQQLKVMTFNIRYDNPNDAPNHWQARIPVVQQYMNQEMPDILGVQESLFHQNEDLLRIMPGYAYIGTGRDDGRQSGEYSPIFYRTNKLELLENGQFWLSETPHVPGSIGWEAILPRVVSWGKFRYLESGRVLFVFNTHFSHVSDLARRKSMEFMSLKIKEIAGDQPIVVTGDFNITKGSELYHHMIAHLKENNNLQNAEFISRDPVVDADATFNAFRHDIEPRVIDYIFVDHHFSVQSYRVDKILENDVFISDHWPVTAVVSLKK